MHGLVDYELAEAHRRELLREAGERRLVQELRKARREARRLVVRDRTGGDGDVGITVRLGLHADDERVAQLLELNGMPRWVAFEERFVVAEQDGEVLAALPYRTEPNRMLLGLPVVDPWAGERRLALALYAGVPELAREMCVQEIRAESRHGTGYLSEAGYRRAPSGWRLDATRSGRGGAALPARGWRRVAALLGVVGTPFFRASAR